MKILYLFITTSWWKANQNGVGITHHGCHASSCRHTLKINVDPKVWGKAKITMKITAGAGGSAIDAQNLKGCAQALSLQGRCPSCHYQICVLEGNAFAVIKAAVIKTDLKDLAAYAKCPKCKNWLIVPLRYALSWKFAHRRKLFWRFEERQRRNSWFVQGAYQTKSAARWWIALAETAWGRTQVYVIMFLVF